MKDGKHQFLTDNSEQLVINHYTEKLLFNIHPNYSSQRYERSSFAIGLRDRTPRHSATSRNHRNMFGIFRKSWKFFSEMRRKCVRKSLSFDSGKESSFQLCYSPFYKREGNFIGEEIDPRLFLGLLPGHAGQLLANLFLCP